MLVLPVGAASMPVLGVAVPEGDPNEEAVPLQAFVTVFEDWGRETERRTHRRVGVRPRQGIRTTDLE